MGWLEIVREAIKIGLDAYKFGKALKAQGEAAKGAELVKRMHERYEEAKRDPGLPPGVN